MAFSIQHFIVYVAIPLAAYLLGSVPFALLIGKAHGVDIRKVGSGNIGATNLGRTLGMKYFWQAFFFDALKGFLPVFSTVLLVEYFNRQGILVDMNAGGGVLGPPHLVHMTLPSWVPLVAGAGAMLGHVFPVWLKFRGGKGVATSFGVVLGVWPLYTISGLIAGAIFVVVFTAFRYISLASMVACCSFAVMVAVLGFSDYPVISTPAERLWPLIYIAVAFALLIVIKHRGNIKRLLSGTEPKWSGKKQAPR